VSTQVEDTVYIFKKTNSENQTPHAKYQLGIEVQQIDRRAGGNFICKFLISVSLKIGGTNGTP